MFIEKISSWRKYKYFLNCLTHKYFKRNKPLKTARSFSSLAMLMKFNNEVRLHLYITVMHPL
jgi:hypothetical protein